MQFKMEERYCLPPSLEFETDHLSIPLSLELEMEGPFSLLSSASRHVVFRSPVRSGFLTPRDLNCNCNQSTDTLEPQKTGLDRCKLVFLGLNRFFDWF